MAVSEQGDVQLVPECVKPAALRPWLGECRTDEVPVGALESVVEGDQRDVRQSQDASNEGLVEIDDVWKATAGGNRDHQCMNKSRRVGLLGPPDPEF